MREGLSLVILPGMDGTGLLLSEFSEALSALSEVIVIDYPTDIALGYNQLADYVARRLPRGDFVLIGESFSGPLALMIATEPPEGLKGVILGASFARLDLPMKPLFFAAASFSPRAIPMFALSFLLMGRWANTKTTRTLRTALNKVSARVLSKRAKEVLAIDVLKQGRRVECPVLLLQAQRDRLIPRSAAVNIGPLCQKLRVKVIDGPHFLFQAAPAECISAIQAFCKGLLASDAR